jgi:hypothetical protein
MNPSTLKKFDKILAQMERRASRPPRRFSMAPIVLAAGLVLGQQLLVRFVPMVWDVFLPSGLEAANSLRGWPGLVWHSAVFCHVYQTGVLAAIGGIEIVTMLLGGRSFFVRLMTRLAAFGVIVLDAGIVLVTLMTSYRVTADASGIPGL